MESESQELTYDQPPPDREVGPTVLIVDDEPLARDRLNFALAKTDHKDSLHILHAMNLDQTFSILSGTPVHVVLLDKNLYPDSDFNKVYDANGIEAIPEMLELQPHLQILIVSGSNETEDVVQAMKYGACGYITKDMSDSLLITHINRAVAVAFLSLEKIRRDRMLDTGDSELGGRSMVFQRVLLDAQILSESNRPVLLLGETGTGKTALAHWMHCRRGRFLKQTRRPFFSINTATLAHNLIESELFGHEKGSFTGATNIKQGLFELANNGTLFLDEIAELPLSLQSKLLTVIEDGTFMRLGGTKTFKSQPKLIFATHQNLEKRVEQGLFREDLFMRISKFPLRLPSLSERKEDIPDILRSLLPRSCEENQVFVPFENIPTDFIEHLIHTPIEGNIRGLQNQLDRLLVFSPRNHQGKPELHRWRSIPGLLNRISIRRKLFNETPDPNSNAPLTFQEFTTRPSELIGPDFPGLNEFLDEIRAKLMQEATRKFKSNKEIASAFKVSESTTSLLSRRHLDRRSPRSPHSAELTQETFDHSIEKDSETQTQVIGGDF